MIKFFLILTLLLGNFSVFGRELPNFEKFSNIIGSIESNNNDYAVGDNGKAISRYQIWQICYEDARNYDKTITFSYKSLTNKENANKVLRAYISKYSKTDNFEEWARLWNGGPNWKNKLEKTNKYWRRFQKVMLAK